jgi:GntR family transcriptional regulator, negative regulator for fad regulon and positive regulator of fabA
MDWTPPLKPAELTEERLIDAIMNGTFAIDTHLPAERELAEQLGVTRPTLREALQRLGRDGWLEIRHGKPTRVRNYWQEGSLGVLGAIAHRSQGLPADFISNLLYVRLLIAPAYTRLAVERQPDAVANLLEAYQQLDDHVRPFAEFDWQLHHQLTITSGNPIFTLILNGFTSLYVPMACRYFDSPATRASSRAFYAGLLSAARDRDPDAAEFITRQTMQESLAFWQQVG